MNYLLCLIYKHTKETTEYPSAFNLSPVCLIPCKQPLFCLPCGLGQCLESFFENLSNLCSRITVKLQQLEELKFQVNLSSLVSWWVAHSVSYSCVLESVLMIPNSLFHADIIGYEIILPVYLHTLWCNTAHRFSTPAQLQLQPASRCEA